jgi:hypothetical protein
MPLKRPFTKGISRGVVPSGGGGVVAAPTAVLVDGNASGGTADSLTPTISWTRAEDDPADGSVTYTVTASLNGSPVALDNAANINGDSYVVDPNVGTVLALSDSEYTFTVTRDGSSASASATAIVNLNSVGAALRLSSRGSLFQDSAGTIPAAEDGDPVGRNNDSIGTRHSTQSSTSNKPTLRLVNSLPVIDFVTDDSLEITSGLDLLRNKAGATVMLLVRFDDNSASVNTAFLASYGVSGNTPRIAINATTIYRAQATRLDADTVITGSGGAVAAATWIVMTVLADYAGGSQIVRINGTQTDTDAYSSGSGNSADTNSAVIREGAAGTTPTNFMDGARFELVVWDTLLNDAVRDACEAYLASYREALNI